MAGQSQPTVKLIQFKCKEPPKSDLVRALPDETLDEWDDRLKKNKAHQPPEYHFKHTGVIPALLQQILQEEKLKLVDAYVQRRIAVSAYDGEIRRRILVTFVFATTSSNSAKRQKDLDERGIRVLQAFLDQRWERVVVTSFPDTPGLQSILFVGKAQNPSDPVPIDDIGAKKFGMVVTRRKPVESHAA